MKGISFGYQKLQPPLLKDFDLTIGPGKWVAFVGGSGSGKSTIARLISQLYQPWSGSITLDGKPINPIGGKEFSKILSFVDQKIVLFNATIRENLSMWKNGISFEQLTNAAKIACIHDWIINRPDGYDHKLSEDGSNVSGGEKARLELARALATEPSLIVLDEATSSLDSETESKIQEALKVLTKDKTTIVIAHRLSTILNSSNIYVIDSGKVVGSGKHEDLLRKSELYKHFYEQQIQK